MTQHKMTANTLMVLDYVRRHGVRIAASGSMLGIGLLKDEDMVAGVIYEGYNGSNIWMHVAITGRINRKFLGYAFSYPFVELGCGRISGYVEASNLAAVRFNEHLGFRREATLDGAATDGGDAYIYTMKREECRHVALAPI